MAITIAKTIASGAAAAIRAYEEGGPYAGPALAALVALTTAASVATIIAQRNAIMHSSVNSTGYGTNGNQNVGDRVINGSMKQGGYAGSAKSDDVPMGIYHANEYVVPAWLVRAEPILFRNMEEYRQTRHRPANFGVGMQNGGYAGPSQPSNVVMSGDPRLTLELDRLSMAIDKLMKNGVQSYLVYNQYNDFMKQRDRFKNITSQK